MSPRRNGQRVAGAALHRTVERQLREELAHFYGLPMDEYAATVDGTAEEMLSVTFERPYDNDGEPMTATIQVDSIEVYPDGRIDQSSRPELN
jgi:hypothetical protein